MRSSEIIENRTAVCCGCTNGVILCRTVTWVCSSDELGLVLKGGYAKNHPVKPRLPPLHRRGIAQCRCNTPPRQATPPGTDAMQSPQRIYTRHLPSTGRELLSADARYHPARLRHQVQMRCNRPSVSVLDISPPQEGNCLVQMQDTTPQAPPATPPQERNCTPTVIVNWMNE